MRDLTQLTGLWLVYRALARRNCFEVPTYVGVSVMHCIVDRNIGLVQLTGIVAGIAPASKFPRLWALPLCQE
jgi:hypothetical protein